MLTRLEALFPRLALRQYQFRAALTETKRLYDAAKNNNWNKRPAGGQSGDAVMNATGAKLRAWARHLDENNDLASGILDCLVLNIVGSGLTFTPIVETKGGKVNKKVNDQLGRLWAHWCEQPDVTGELSFGEVQRLLVRSWLRDGEVLINHVEGTTQGLPLGGPVPYHVELIEADLLPFDLHDDSRGIMHGVERNQWGRPVAYHVFKQHPGSVMTFSASLNRDTKRVSADDITHLKFSKRIKQARGVPILHAVIHRLDDLGQFEESERIAARVNACLTSVITKSAELAGPASTGDDARDFQMSPGMVYDKLQPGESVEVIDSKRPSSGIKDFRAVMMRAVAAGVGCNYSSISKDYSGTYSSQRQSMVESAPGYARLRSQFVADVAIPVYRRFVHWAIQTGQVKSIGALDERALSAVSITAPGMAWIDPKKEMEADEIAMRSGVKSRQQVIREHGGDPVAVDQQIEMDEFKAPEPAQVAAVAAVPDDDEEPQAVAS